MNDSNFDWLAFTETDLFTKQLDKLTTIETLYALQDNLLKNPRRGKVIKGTHGARKDRIGDAVRKTGKRGSYRYIYIYLEKAERIYLILFYGKSNQSDMTPSQVKQVGELVLKLKEIYDK